MLGWLMEGVSFYHCFAKLSIFSFFYLVCTTHWKAIDINKTRKIKTVIVKTG